MSDGEILGIGILVAVVVFAAVFRIGLVWIALGKDDAPEDVSTKDWTRVTYRSSEPTTRKDTVK